MPPPVALCAPSFHEVSWAIWPGPAASDVPPQATTKGLDADSFGDRAGDLELDAEPELWRCLNYNDRRELPACFGPAARPLELGCWTHKKIGCDFSQPFCLSDQEETNCRRRHRQDAASVSGGLRHRPSTSLTRPSRPQSVRSNSDYGGELACRQ